MFHSASEIFANSRTFLDLFLQVTEKDIPGKVFRAVLTSHQRFGLSQKCQLFTRLVTEVDETIVETRLLPAFVSTLIEEGKLADKFPQDSLTLMTETIAAFVSTRKDSGYGKISAGGGHESTFSLEFPCAR